MYFRNCGLQKTLLHKCLKSPIVEDPWTRNMINSPKQCPNLHDNTFIILIDPAEGN